MPKGLDKSDWKLIGLSALGLGAAIPIISKVGREIVKRTTRNITKILITDLYEENLWELVSAITRVSPQVIAETNFRAERRDTLKRPLGTTRKFPHFDNIMFNIAQLHTLPTPIEHVPSLQVVIGKRAKKPLCLDMPILIPGFAYGFALSESAKVALAKGATLAGTATNTGEGPFLQSERDAAKHLIIQYNRGHWSKSSEILRQADMIEVQLGQGTLGGVAHVFPSRLIDPKLRQQYGLAPKEDAIVHSRLERMKEGKDLAKIIEKLREIVPDIPIGVKIAGSKYIEKDLDIILDAGVDVITLDGAQAATKGSPPLLQDSFGLPTLYCLTRTVRHLREVRRNTDVDIIISGGIFTPEHALKAIALGATAVYMGTTILFALSHTQLLHALPFEPPTQVVWYHGKYSKKFDIEKGAQSVANYLISAALELKESIRALGKRSITEVNKDDLMCLDDETAKITGLSVAYKPIT